jgi:hypothetical protein
MRVRRVAVVLAAVLVTSAIAVLVLGLMPGGGGGDGLTRASYLARASAICQSAGAKLDVVPPIEDPTQLGVVIASVDAALPILTDQRDRVRALLPPLALRRRVARFFALTDRSLETLASVRQAAENMNVGNVAIGLERFGAETTAAKLIARRIGYRC